MSPVILQTGIQVFGLFSHAGVLPAFVLLMQLVFSVQSVHQGIEFRPSANSILSSNHT